VFIYYRIGEEMKRTSTAGGKLSIILIFLFFCGGLTYAQTQEFDIQEYFRQKTKLWEILQQNGIQPAIVSDKLTNDQKKTLASIKKVNDYPIYIMTYYGDYGFDEFIKKGHTTDFAPEYNGEACSCFGALSSKGSKIYGRNLDLTNRYPVLFLRTDSPTGYAAVTLHAAIDIELYLSDPSEQHTQWVLEYPFWPFDGMNEYGVAISGLNVPGKLVYDPNKISLNRYELRRLVLDHARNVEEAIALLRSYNCTSSDSVHYLVSDASGKSAVIEYYNGRVNAKRNTEPWQIATNFMQRGRAPETVLGECHRYATVYNSLLPKAGFISRWEGKNILSSVARYQLPVGDNVYIYTVWSAIYDLTTGWTDIYPGTQYGNKQALKLQMINDMAVLKAGIKPSQITPKEEFAATVKIKNWSPRPSQKTFVDLYLSPKKKLTQKAVHLGKQKLKVLSAGKNKLLRFKKNLPDGMTAGDYYLVAVVDEQGRNNDPMLKNNTLVWNKKVVVK